MTTDWAHLPNAVHIDRVFASVKANPDHWTESWNTVQDAGRSAEYNAAWLVARDAAWNTVQDAGRSAEWWEVRASCNSVREAEWIAEYNAAWLVARDASCNSVRDATRCALLALCAYDDCAYMLDSDPGELAILAAFGDHRAILLLYACKVFHSLKEIV